jgi:hypothetical protein
MFRGGKLPLDQGTAKTDRAHDRAHPVRELRELLRQPALPQKSESHRSTKAQVISGIFLACCGLFVAGFSDSKQV